VNTLLFLLLDMFVALQAELMGVIITIEIVVAREDFFMIRM